MKLWILGKSNWFPPVVVFVTAVCAWGQDRPFVGPRQDLTFRSNISLVRVDVQVTQGDRVVSGLTRDDFVVRDDGRAQPIVYFRHEEDPIDLIIILDTSGSMRPAIRRVNGAAHQALTQLKKGDRVAVTSFTMRARIAQDLTEDFSLVESAIDRICSRPFRGGTNIHGALEHASEYLLDTPRTARRRALLMITDGKSPSFSHRMTVLKKMWEADAALDVLLVKAGGRQFNLTIPIPGKSVDVSKLAEETGGDVVKAEKIGESFRQIIDRIRRRYSLHYALPAGNEGDQHTVRVELSDSARKIFGGARVRSRKGYVWTAAPNDSSTGISSALNSPTVP